jgi:glycolate oxidase iron-sulfur subunit
LKARKLANIARTRPQAVATGNIGCMTQLSSGSAIPFVHSVELLDWAYGGPLPEALAQTGFVTQPVQMAAAE